MKKYACLLALLLSMNFAFAAEPCMKEMAGKTACVAGDLMLCNKEFDSGMHDFKYEWHAINNAGQSFDIYYDAMYKKIPGLTPASCGGSVSTQDSHSSKLVNPTSKPVGNESSLILNVQHKKNGSGPNNLLSILAGIIWAAILGLLLWLRKKDPAFGCAKYRRQECDKSNTKRCPYPNCAQTK